LTVCRNRSSDPIAYRGELTTSSVFSWISKRRENGVGYFSRFADFLNFKRHVNSFALGYFPSADEDTISTFRYMNQAIRDFPLIYTYEEEIGRFLNLSSNCIILVSETGESPVLLNDLTDTLSIDRFIRFHRSPPLLDARKYETFLNQLDLNFPTAFLINRTANVPTQTIARAEGLILVYVPNEEVRMKPVIEWLGCDNGLVIVLEPLNPVTRKYMIKNIDSDEEIISFLSTFSNSPEYIKSQPPKDLRLNTTEPSVLVGSNFGSFLEIDSVFKLVLFHARWCGLCDGLTDMFTELARRLPIHVAMIDMSRNDSPGVLITKYPTVVLFSQSGSEIARIDTEITNVDQVLDWITSVVSLSTPRDEL
jgi:thiol-disulfide isomerase/thioredoxin